MQVYTVAELSSRLGVVRDGGIPFKITREVRPLGEVVAHIEVRGRPLESVRIADECAEA